ncbi:MAG TPA: hypothetical protein VIL00_07765 [Pseudonocardiaceae bacterium]
MTGHLWTQTTQVRLGASLFEGAAEQLAAAHSTLQGDLDAEGQCWGNDEAGQNFAQNYVPASQKVLETFAQLTEALRGIRTGLDEMANTWEEADSGNASGLNATYQG